MVKCLLPQHLEKKESIIPILWVPVVGKIMLSPKDICAPIFENSK